MKQAKTTPDSKEGLHTQGDAFEKQDFFDLMQQYRIAPMTDQERVIERYESVKEYIRNERKALLDALEKLYKACKFDENNQQLTDAMHNAWGLFTNAKNVTNG